MNELEGYGAQGGDTTRTYDSKFLTPPAWKTKTMNYTDFKFETELWSKFTLMEKKQQGFAVYSTLPHEDGVAQKIRLALQSGEINLEDDQAVNNIFRVLDKWYGKDDLSATNQKISKISKEMMIRILTVSCQGMTELSKNYKSMELNYLK